MATKWGRMAKRVRKRTVQEAAPTEIERAEQRAHLPDLSNGTAAQLIEATWIPKGATENEKRERIKSAYALRRQLDPKGAGEEMLVSQLVATHGAAMEWMRRAMDADQPYVAIDIAIKQSEKFMSLFLRQVAALDKHRGKGQQKVVVEHVHLGQGAQAVFGPVEPRGHRGSAPKDITPPKDEANKGTTERRTRYGHEKE